MSLDMQLAKFGVRDVTPSIPDKPLKQILYEGKNKVSGWISNANNNNGAVHPPAPLLVLIDGQTPASSNTFLHIGEVFGINDAARVEVVNFAPIGGIVAFCLVYSQSGSAGTS